MFSNPASLTLYLVAIGGSVTALIAITLASSARPFRRTLAGVLLPLVLAGLALAAWEAAQSTAVYLPLAAFAGLGGICQLSRVPQVAQLLARTGSLAADPRWAWGVLLLACPLLAFWWSSAADEPGLPLEPKHEAATDAGNPNAALEILPDLARTDRGRPIELFRVSDPNAPSMKIPPSELSRMQLYKVSERLLRMGPASASYNCHGWVFAGGRYRLENPNDVDVILKDNGYVAATVPQEDDLAIYRSPIGVIVHSGLVRAASEDGLVLVESKWGPLERYIHKPDPLPFDVTARCTYYRSARRGHLLRGLADAKKTASPRDSSAARDGNP